MLKAAIRKDSSPGLGIASIPIPICCAREELMDIGESGPSGFLNPSAMRFYRRDVKVGWRSGEQIRFGVVAAENRPMCACSFHNHLYNGRSGSAQISASKRGDEFGASAHIFFYKLSLFLPTSL